MTFAAVYGPVQWRRRDVFDPFWREMRAYVGVCRGTDVVIGGDLNVGLSHVDNEIGPTREWTRWADPQYQAIRDAGFIDVWRHHNAEGQREFSFYPPRRKPNREPHGRRLDHVFATPGAASRIGACWYDHAARTRNKGKRDSDHSAMLFDIDLEVPRPS